VELHSPRVHLIFFFANGTKEKFPRRNFMVHDKGNLIIHKKKTIHPLALKGKWTNVLIRNGESWKSKKRARLKKKMIIKFSNNSFLWFSMLLNETLFLLFLHIRIKFFASEHHNGPFQQVSFCSSSHFLLSKVESEIYENGSFLIICFALYCNKTLSFAHTFASYWFNSFNMQLWSLLCSILHSSMRTIALCLKFLHPLFDAHFHQDLVSNVVK
jgi:hypothetical protein